MHSTLCSSCQQIARFGDSLHWLPGASDHGLGGQRALPTALAALETGMSMSQAGHHECHMIPPALLHLYMPTSRLPTAMQYECCRHATQVGMHKDEVQTSICTGRPPTMIVSTLQFLAKRGMKFHALKHVKA
jgi:hypothetical protein